MKTLIAVLLLSSVCFAGVAKIASFPARHPKRSAHAAVKASEKSVKFASKGVYHGAKRSAHIAKKVTV